MEPLKILIFNRFKILSLLFAAMALSMLLLMIRMKLNQSFHFLFLVWNLFLALIPFAITTALASGKKPHKLYFLVVFLIWLLFLPNAPYIVTDLLHLQNSDRYLMWLDVLVILSFATNGLALYFLSLYDMEQSLKRFFNPKFTKVILVFIVLLTAFGIYLGRFLRYNSWEILNHPFDILLDVGHILFQPNIEAWMFTLTFASFLAMLYWTLKTFTISEDSNEKD
jgi:uncharacterized membrane protein